MGRSVVVMCRDPGLRGKSRRANQRSAASWAGEPVSTTDGTSHLAIGEVLTLLQLDFPDVTISKIRFLESGAEPAWAVTGRLNIMASHAITKRKS